MRAMGFIAIVILILSSCSFYVGVRSIKHLQLGISRQIVVWVILVLFVALQILSGYMSRLHPELMVSNLLQWTSHSALGVFGIYFFCVIVTDIFFLMSHYVYEGDVDVSFSRRSFLTFGALGTSAAVMGFYQAVKGPKVYEVEVPIEDLPDNLKDFRIVQISDLHVSPTIRKNYVENVVKMANELSPDLLALTGDFSDGDVNELRSDIRPLKDLKAKYGTYFVTGNHEYYWDPEGWLKEYRDLGMTILMNENILIQNNLVVAGVSDYSTSKRGVHAHNPKLALDGASKDAIKILLAHQPETYREASGLGVHLQLSGHTHAGQFFPFSLLMPLAHRYYKGLNRHDKMWIYVNQGTGYWGPPQRFGIPSEITLLRLKKV